MPTYKTWDQLFNPKVSGAAVLATVADIKTQLSAASSLTHKPDASSQDEQILHYMSVCALDMREKVDIRMQDKFPESAAYYISVYQRAVNMMNSQMFPNGFPNFGYISTLGNYTNYGDQGLTDDPQVFLSMGFPNNTRYQGAAYQGAFCVDTTPSNTTLYINRGTLDANDWQFYTASDIAQFYLTNPIVLTRAFIYGTLFYLFEDVTSETLAANQSLSLPTYTMHEERYEKKYKELLSAALDRLRPDISNSGVVTSLDLRSQKKQWGIR